MSRKDTKRCYWSNGRVQNTFGAVPDKKTVTCLTKDYSLNLPNQPIEQWLGWSWTIFEEKKGNYMAEIFVKIDFTIKNPNEEAK